MQCFDLCVIGEVGDWFVDFLCWGVVVFGGDGQVELVEWVFFVVEVVEGLWVGDFVYEVQVDVDEVGLFVFVFDDEVVVLDFFGECFGVCGICIGGGGYGVFFGDGGLVYDGFCDEEGFRLRFCCGC